MTVLKNILEEAIRNSVTDIHLEEGSIPYFRKGNDLYPVGTQTVHIESFTQLRGKKETQDFSISHNETRFRVHCYEAQGKVCAALRLLQSQKPSLDDDADGELWKQLCERENGLVLVTGSTGSGKSYTLGACINYINDTMHRHIITLEDPIEMIFDTKKSLIHQRELHYDISSMGQGLKDALREDPDVLMIGEMRDSETIESALHAAETGHLVFATMHTARAWQAVSRMLSVFEGAKQAEMRSLVSQVVCAIICQRMVYVEGRYVYIRDILLNTVAVANLIRQGKEYQIESVQETNRPMRTMRNDYEAMVEKYGPQKELVRLKDSL